MVLCQGWLGKGGARWAQAIGSASNKASRVIELVRDLFIPDVRAHWLAYRCIPKAPVECIN